MALTSNVMNRFLVGETMSEQSQGVIKIKPSLVPFVWKGVTVILLGLVLYTAVLALRPRYLPYLPSPIPQYAVLILVGLGFSSALIGVVRRNMFTYLITESDLIVQKQLLSRNIRRIPFTSLSDIEVSQTLIGRLAGYGNIAPVTKSGYGLVRGIDRNENVVAEMTNVPNPNKVADLIISRSSIKLKS
jgi:membrane protein YdbS with pleckstrin-like domain